MFENKQALITQYSLRFKGPIVDDMIVDNISDLVNLNINYAYQHKLVWVKAEECYYYIVNGNGSRPNHWKKFAQEVTINPYEQNNSYGVNQIVYLNNKLYKSNASVAPNEIPGISPKWQTIVGEIASQTIAFSDESVFKFQTTIKNPFFEVWEGELKKVGGSFETDVDGFIKLYNGEKIDCQITQLSDGYELRFYENGVPSPTTGIVKIK